VDLRFEGELWYWRGPAPFHFVSVPEAECEELADVAPRVSYGWGMVPAQVRIGATGFRTALWPKDGGYVVPVKTAVRRAERLEVGDTVRVRLTVEV
jgi:hypothetical protein